MNIFGLLQYLRNKKLYTFCNQKKGFCFVTIGPICVGSALLYIKKDLSKLESDHFLAKSYLISCLRTWNSITDITITYNNPIDHTRSPSTLNGHEYLSSLLVIMQISVNLSQNILNQSIILQSQIWKLDWDYTIS